MKRCSRCKKNKPIKAFHKCTSQKSGRQSFCIPCKAEYGQMPNQKAAKAKQARSTNGKQNHQRACRKYNTSPKGLIAYARYNKSPKGQATKLHHVRLRQTRCKNATHDPVALKEFYFELRTRKTITCFWCDNPVPKRKRHGDHVVPLSKGGAHCISNLVPACSNCNIRRGTYYV